MRGHHNIVIELWAATISISGAPLHIHPTWLLLTAKVFKWISALNVVEKPDLALRLLWLSKCPLVLSWQANTQQFILLAQSIWWMFSHKPPYCTVSARIYSLGGPARSQTHNLGSGGSARQTLHKWPCEISIKWTQGNENVLHQITGVNSLIKDEKQASDHLWLLFHPSVKFGAFHTFLMYSVPLEGFPYTLHKLLCWQLYLGTVVLWVKSWNQKSNRVNRWK